LTPVMPPATEPQNCLAYILLSQRAIRRKEIPMTKPQRTSLRWPLGVMLVAGLTLAGAAMAQVKVSDAWARGTVAQQMATGAFMKITTADRAKLVGAESPVAGVVEIHEMAMDNNVMRMRAVAGIELSPGRAVELKPDGYHVMLMDLKRQLKAGETVPLTLQIERGGRREAVEVKAVVRAPTAHGDGMGMH
jgi:copper(I)-binding protein